MLSIFIYSQELTPKNEELYKLWVYKHDKKKM